MSEVQDSPLPTSELTAHVVFTESASKLSDGVSLMNNDVFLVELSGSVMIAVILSMLSSSLALSMRGIRASSLNECPRGWMTITEGGVPTTTLSFAVLLFEKLSFADQVMMYVPIRGAVKLRL